MRTRQEQSDDTLLQRARLRLGWSFKELGEALGVSEQTAERYCLPSGERKIQWMGPGPASRLKALCLRADTSGPLITVENFRDRADPAPARTRKPKGRARA